MSEQQETFIAHLVELRDRLIRALRAIGIVFVYLEVERASVMPDHWVYLPSPELAVHRVSEFKNFCDGAAPGDSTALCCEITCRPGDARWNLTPGEAETIARSDLVRAGLLQPGEGRLLHVARLAQAYPVYDLGYRERVQALRRETRRVANLTTTGRQGLFRYCNMNECIEIMYRALRMLAGGDARGRRRSVHARPTRHRWRNCC